MMPLLRKSQNKFRDFEEQDNVSSRSEPEELVQKQTEALAHRSLTLKLSVTMRKHDAAMLFSCEFPMFGPQDTMSSRAKLEEKKHAKQYTKFLDHPPVRWDQPLRLLEELLMLLEEGILELLERHLSFRHPDLAHASPADFRLTVAEELVFVLLLQLAVFLA